MARTAVLPQKIEELLKQHHLLSANEIITRLAQAEKKYNKTSIYRALEKLEQTGKICKENFGDSEALYELRAKHHDHAICTNCDSILAVQCTNHILKHIPGFQPDHHHTTIYGLCQSCVKKK